MEKRNYVTSGRTVSDDETIESAAAMFGKLKTVEDPFEKIASEEDEKSDSE